MVNIKKLISKRIALKLKKYSKKKGGAQSATLKSLIDNMLNNQHLTILEHYALNNAIVADDQRVTGIMSEFLTRLNSNPKNHSLEDVENKEVLNLVNELVNEEFNKGTHHVMNVLRELVLDHIENNMETLVQKKIELYKLLESNRLSKYFKKDQIKQLENEINILSSRYNSMENNCVNDIIKIQKVLLGEKYDQTAAEKMCLEKPLQYALQDESSADKKLYNLNNPTVINNSN
jgi:hypothetical protein